MKKMGLSWPLDILPYVGLEWGYVEFAVLMLLTVLKNEDSTGVSAVIYWIEFFWILSFFCEHTNPMGGKNIIQVILWIFLQQKSKLWLVIMKKGKNCLRICIEGCSSSIIIIPYNYICTFGWKLFGYFYAPQLLFQRSFVSICYYICDQAVIPTTGEFVYQGSRGQQFSSVRPVEENMRRL